MTRKRCSAQQHVLACLASIKIGFSITGIVAVLSTGVWPMALRADETIGMASRPKVYIRANDAIHGVWDSGLFPNEPLSPIFWVDDSTILVAANKGQKPRTMEEMREREAWLYLWKLGEQPRPYGANPRDAAVAYCAAKGEVSFHQKEDPNTRTRWVGPPGQEREAAPWTPSFSGISGNSPLSVQPDDCEIFSDPSMDGQFYVTDPGRRFYVVYGPTRGMPNETNQLVLMHADGTRRVTLPIRRGQGTAHFHTFDKVFYIYNGNLTDIDDLGYLPFVNPFKQWREESCWPYWRVDPETERINKSCVPYGSWVGETHLPEKSGALIDLLPTKMGVYFSFSRRMGASGVYKLEGSSVRRVLEGTVRYAVVSPNGCRIAFVHIPSDEAYIFSSSVSSTIAAVDVCAPRAE